MIVFLILKIHLIIKSIICQTIPNTTSIIIPYGTTITITGRIVIAIVATARMTITGATMQILMIQVALAGAPEIIATTGTMTARLGTPMIVMIGVQIGVQVQIMTGVRITLPGTPPVAMTGVQVGNITHAHYSPNACFGDFFIF